VVSLRDVVCIDAFLPDRLRNARLRASRAQEWTRAPRIRKPGVFSVASIGVPDIEASTPHRGRNSREAGLPATCKTRPRSTASLRLLVSVAQFQTVDPAPAAVGQPPAHSWGQPAFR
jgi:hypothetical protein